MAWDRGLALLLLLATPGLGQRPPPTPGAPGLRHSYDCGVEGVQLLVLPPEGRTVRFKVMGECPLTRDPCPGCRALGLSPCRRDRKRRGLPPPHREEGWSLPQFPWSPRQPRCASWCHLATGRAQGPGSEAQWACPPLSGAGCGPRGEEGGGFPISFQLCERPGSF